MRWFQGSRFVFALLFQMLLVPNLSFGQVDLPQDDIDTDTIPAFSVEAEPAYIYASANRNPITVSPIRQETIEKLTEPTVETLLNTVPGLWMQTGALNTNRISIRGVGYREPFATTGIKIYLDEIPLTNGAGESSIEDIHPFLFSGIDVWRGPSSALWGSGLGGMIHLKTKSHEQSSWNSRFQIGSFNRFQTDHHFALRYGHDERLASVFHYQFIHDDGYRENNEYNKHSFTWGQQWQNYKGLTIRSFLHAIDLKAFIPSSINKTDFNEHPSNAAPTWLAVRGNEDYSKWITGINFTYTNSHKWIYQGALFGTFFHSDEVRPFNVLDESNIAYGMRHRYTFNLKDSGHLNAGFEFFKETYEFSTFETLEGGLAGDKLSDQEENRTYANVFLQCEMDLAEKWIIFGGLHLTLNKLSDAEVIATFPLSVYPTAGMNYKFSTDLSISANVSRGYSNLSIDDVLNSSGMLAPGIKPETGWSEEVAVMFGDYHSMYARIGFYHMDIDNSVITIRIADDIFEKVNSGSSIHNGIETEYRMFPEKAKMNLAGSYTFSSNHFSKEEGGKALPASPKHKTHHRLSYRPYEPLELYLVHQYVSDIFLNDTNSEKAQGYQLINIGALYDWQINRHWKFSFSCNVHNVLDVSYASMFQINAPSANGGLPRYYYPGKPRSAYGAVSIKYLMGKSAISG